MVATRTRWMAWITLFLLGFLAFAPTLRLGFLLDDHKLIPENPRLREWTVENVKHDWVSNVFDDPAEDPYYRPFLTFMDRVDQSLWHGRPSGFHFTNIFFHMLACGLLFELLVAMVLPVRVAWLVSSLFAVHPMVVDAFLLITARGEQMSMVFSLAVVLGLLRKPGAHWLWILPSYLLALASKESAVITPALVALTLAYRREASEAYVRVIPLVLVTVPYVIVRHLVVGSILHVPADVVSRFMIDVFPRVLWGYVAHALVPLELHFPRQIHLSGHWSVIPLLLWVTASVYIVRRGPGWAVWSLLWFVLTMLPKAASMIVGFAFDHWVYMALPAVMMLPAIILDRGMASSSKVARGAAQGGWIVVTAGFMALAWWNVSIRGQDETALRWALRYETLASLEFKLGALLWREGRPVEAYPYVQDAALREPDQVTYQNAYALVEWDLHQRQEAIALLDSVSAKYPHDQATLHNLTEMRRQEEDRQSPK